VKLAPAVGGEVRPSMGYCWPQGLELALVLKVGPGAKVFKLKLPPYSRGP
jgi:hypothetical protein